jgi:hypothetical protein
MDILDLDALLPPPKKVKIGGKIIEVLPLTIRQLVSVAKLEERLKQVNNEDEIMAVIRETLSPFIPALKEDQTIDFTIAQMKRLVEFAQEVSAPEPDAPSKQYTVEKKISSPAESPTSSTTIPVTPQIKS